MQRERQDDLAVAWWAFFIATQAIAFRGLGLPAPEIAETAEICASLLPNPALEKALRLALAASAEHAHALEAKTTGAFLGRLVAGAPEPRRNVDITDFSVSPETAENYLRKMIGAAAWAKLHAQSRRDLIEAEQLWSKAALELGHRRDWGALIALYARAVEAEVREVATPVFEAARKYCNRSSAKPTLGECLRASDDMLAFLKRNPRADVAPDLRLRVERFGEVVQRVGRSLVFSMGSLRNRADHGDREQPVSGAEFEQWRRTMFERGLFTHLASLA